MKKQMLNEEFLKMQKLAGLITESKYKSKLNEEYNDTSEKQISDYWSIMVDEQPNDVKKMLTDLTMGKLSYDDFISNTNDDVYDSFKDEMYDDEDQLNENEEMYGWEEDDLTDEELKKVKILMALKPYKNKIDKLDMDEIIPGTDYSFSQIDFPEQEIVFTKEDTDPEYGWYDSERHTFDFFDVDDKLLKSFLRWLNSKGIK